MKTNDGICSGEHTIGKKGDVAQNGNKSQKTHVGREKSAQDQA
ncbi:hypothetical protein [Bradyrhizobium sp. NAS80.1]|nr:hypothetical protein [Bradyrhizobium sp. NAS80.1]